MVKCNSSHHNEVNHSTDLSSPEHGRFLLHSIIPILITIAFNVKMGNKLEYPCWLNAILLSPEGPDLPCQQAKEY